MTTMALALVATLLATTSSPPPAQQERPPAAATPDQPFLRFSERTEDGRDKDYPASSVVDVDVNSAILVQFSTEALAALQHEPASPPDAARTELVRRLKEIADLQDAVNAAARDVVDADRVLANADARGANLTGEDLTRFQTAYGELASVFRRLQGYMGRKAYSALVRSSESVVTGGSQFLASEHARLQEQVRSDLEKIPKRVVTLTAYIGNPPRQVHVPGYDNLAPGEPTLLEKTRFRFDADFEKEYAAAKALAAKASDWNALRDAAIQALRARLSDVQKQLEAVIRAMPANVKAQPSAPETVKEAFEELAAPVQNLRDAITGALPKVKAALHPEVDSDPALLLSGAVDALQEIATQVRPTVQAMTNVVETVREAKVALAPELQKLPEALERLERSVLITDIAGAPGAAPLAPQVAALRVKLDDARPTAISLLGTHRSDGDVLTVSARILDEDGETSRAIAGGETTTYFRVRSRGIVADTGAVVLFTRPIGHDPGAFVPGAGAFAVFRFKGWRDGGDANSSFWYYAAPGLGISAIAIPRTSDGSTQIGWMGTFHLFGDILQVAAGTTMEAKPVWGFGIGLHRIAGIGKYFQ